MEEWILASSTSPWALFLLFALVAMDGLVPLVPSEVLLISLGTLAPQGEGPPLVLVGCVAFAGAFVGENLAYVVGSFLPIERIRYFSTEKGGRRLDAVRRRLRTHGAAYILAARFLPGVRVIVNMCVGAAGYPRSRFMILAAITSVLWAAFMLGMGVGAGHLLAGKPLLSMLMGVVAGTVIGIVIDRLLSGRLHSDSDDDGAA
ncbi:MAG: DedA family protein [Ancrocorticia sp.]